MKTVIVPKARNSSLIAILEMLYRVFKGMGNEGVAFDLSQVEWKHPLLLLPLAAYIHETGSMVSRSASGVVDSYLAFVRFPEGVDSISSFEEWAQRNKSYVPISILKKGDGKNREMLESLFVEMIHRILESQIQGVYDAISYPITELVANIIEHSNAEQGMVFGQYYPKKNYLDICIVDRGRGLAASYKEEMNLKFSDEDAITEAMQGHSTKPNKERGYGIRTSKNVVCNALGGEFVYLSGSAVLFSNKERERLAILPDFYWQGVIIAYRIPKPATPIDIYPFLE